MRLISASLLALLLAAGSSSAAQAKVSVEGGSTGSGDATVDVEASDRTDRRSGYNGSPARQNLSGVPSSPNAVAPELITSCGLATQEICDFSVSTPRPIPNRADPVAVTTVAREYFRSIPVPAPRPRISAPNGGITGAEHSLDLQIGPEMIFTDPATQFGALTLHVYGTFTVDWGDGTRSTYKSTGAPWPNSTLKHSWSRVGPHDITVTADWSADWSLHGYQGTLTGLRTTGVIAGWPVLEAQAVLTR